MHTIISAEQLRILLNDTREVMGQQPWIQAVDDHAHAVTIPAASGMMPWPQAARLST